MAFSPDGRWLATSWPDAKLRLWPLPGTGPREPRILELPDPTLWANLVFDPRGRYLFVVGNSDRAIVAPLDGVPAAAAADLVGGNPARRGGSLAERPPRGHGLRLRQG